MFKSQLKCKNDMCCREGQVRSRGSDKKCQGRDLVHFWQPLWDRTGGTGLYQTSNGCLILSVMGSNLGLIALKPQKCVLSLALLPRGGSKEGRKHRLETGRGHESVRRANRCTWWFYTSYESQGMALLPPQLNSHCFEPWVSITLGWVLAKSQFIGGLSLVWC